MAKLIKSHRQNIGNYIDALIKGDYIHTSIDYGLNQRTNIARQLDKLRLILLDLRSSEVENKQKSLEMIGNITHDLKTPLALISGYAESLADGMKDKDYTQLIQQRIKEMDSTVINIIEATKMDVSHYNEEKRHIVLRDYLPTALEKALLVAKEKDIKCKIGRIPKKDAFIATSMFERAINNIVANAVKHTSAKGSLHIKFAVRGRWLTIAIKDNGSGIKEEDLPYVFDLYYTDDSARTTGGTGMGLAQVKNAIEWHGGRVNIKSKQGKGCTFYITIECFNGDELVPQKQQEARRCKKWISFVLCMLFGYFGVHYLYEGRMAKALLYACTVGLFCFGWIVDIFRYILKSDPYYVAVK